MTGPERVGWNPVILTSTHKKLRITRAKCPLRMMTAFYRGLQ